MGCFEKFSMFFATKYGYVTSGKYSGFKVIFGNASGSKAQANNNLLEIIFLNGKKICQQYNICTDIEDMKVLFPNKVGYHCLLTFCDGDKCELDIYRNKAYTFVENISKCMNKKMIELF